MKKKIALVAHDGRKQDLLEWVKFNVGTLREHELYATGTTGKVIAGAFRLSTKVSESDGKVCTK